MTIERYIVYDDRTDQTLYESNSSQLCISFMTSNYLNTEDAPHIWLKENTDYEKMFLSGGIGSTRKIEW